MRIGFRASSALSCFGEGPAAHQEALRAGRCGLRRQGEDDQNGLGLPAALLPGGPSAERHPLVLVERQAEKLLAATGLSHAERERCAVFFGGTTGLEAVEESAWLAREDASEPWHSNLRSGGPGRLAAMLAARLGSRAPVFTFTTACTSTAVGMVMAARMLRAGQIERALVVGLDLLTRIAADGFRYLQLYSETSCRPFDASRDGLQLGEACALLLLEPDAGGACRFELLDGAIAHDPSHIAAGSSDGGTGAAVMSEALRRSGVEPSEVTAIKAHGTGTPTNDLSEQNALTRVFGSRPPPFASLKGALGHALGSSAALETAAWLWCLEDGFVPPCVGFDRAADGACEPLRAPLATAGRPGVHLFNAFGFGGTSVSFLVRDHGAP